MSFREWFEDADMPMRRDDGTWYDAETGISFSASSEAAPYRIQYNPSADVQGYRDYAKQFGGKALTGSPKQKDWAEKIRAEKLAEAKDHAGVDVLARSKLFSSAKFWIENRTEKGGVLAEYATNYLAVMRMMQKLADTAVAIQRKEKTNIITTAKPVYALHEKYMRELGKSESNIKLLTEQIVSAALNESSVLITQFADTVKAMNQPQAKPQPYSVQDAIEETIKALLLKLEESDDPIAQLGTSIQLMDAIQQRDIHQQHDARVARFIVKLVQERIPEIKTKAGDSDLLDSAQALLADMKAVTKSDNTARIQDLDRNYSLLINRINAIKTGYDSIAGELEGVTDQDIDSDPLAVLDLCVEFMQSNTASTRLNSENQKPTLEKFIKKTIVATEKTRYYRRFYVGLKSNESFVDARNDLKELLKQGYASRSTSNEKWIHSRLRDYSLAEFSTDKWYPPKTEREAKEMAYAAFYEGKDVGSALVFQKKPNLTAFDSALDGFDSIGSELDAITDQDIDSDPLAVLDLCVGVLEGATDAITPTGRANPVKTAKGTKIGTQFAVVEVEKLITSHDSAGNENPAFPQELQPRDRSRDASRAWVAKTANSLDNDSLGRTSRADSGAPIVGRDGIVESGNGRTMAIRMAYDQGTADEYRQFLIDDADYFGIDPDQVERMKRPVLVRVRTTDIDRRVFTVEANQDDKLALSATERARSDAKRLDSELLAVFAPGEDGDLNTAANQRFIQGFLKSIGDNEAAQYMTTDGKPTKGLIDRIQAAIFSKAYNDDRLLEMMADQTKTEIKNVISALNSAAPKFIESQAYSRLGTEAVSEQVVDGIEQSLNQRVIDAVIEATNTLLAAKAKNQDITEYVTQGGLFEGIDEGVAALAVFLSQNARNPKRIGIAFKAMAEFVKTDAIDQTNVGLFGEPVPPSMVDVVAAANREIQRIYGDDDDKTIGLFDDPVEPEPVTETKTVTVKVPISVNLINEATSAAWSGLEKLNDDAFLKVWKNLKAADYMRRRSIRPTGERKSNQHILNQAASGDVQKMVDSEVAKRGFEKKYTLFIEQKDVNGFDSYLADGRYDHIHLDDLQMHPYANAAKERQPTAKTPLLVQKNRRGDLYLIAGVKRYEMALDDDLEYLPAVILPVVEGYGDPVIKRVLNAYTGSIDPLALMAAIEDAVTERAGKSLIS